MPKCPDCDYRIENFSDIDEVRLGDDHQAALANGRAIYCCPACESILGIGEWHSAV